MSKCKKYVKGGGINPFWVMEQMGKYDNKESNSKNSINFNINIDIGNFHINGTFGYDNEKPNDKKLAIKRVSKHS